MSSDMIDDTKESSVVEGESSLQEDLEEILSQYLSARKNDPVDYIAGQTAKPQSEELLRMTFKAQSRNPAAEFCTRVGGIAFQVHRTSESALHLNSVCRQHGSAIQVTKRKSRRSPLPANQTDPELARGTEQTPVRAPQLTPQFLGQVEANAGRRPCLLASQTGIKIP